MDPDLRAGAGGQSDLADDGPDHGADAGGPEAGPEPDDGAATFAFVDLHCHTSASFDCLADPARVARAARHRGLTHLAVTDHDRIDGALRARAAAPPGLTVIVGEEVKTTGGDLICLFLREAIPPGLSPRAAIDRARQQGALVGIPHPFDRHRGSMANAAGTMTELAPLVDWVEGYNARVVLGDGNERAASFAIEAGLPSVAVSDAHSVLEVGVAYTRVPGDPATPEGLLAGLVRAELQPGHATYLVRGITPVATVIQRLRGNGRRSASSGPAT